MAGPKLPLDASALTNRTSVDNAPIAVDGAVPGTDLLTMADAARIKGVSYHTVSRAVRRGRLPVQRLGRMALIAAQDLADWQPMTERRPRRYQQRDEDRTLHAFGQASDETIAFTETFAGLVEALSEDALTGDVATFLQRGAERIGIAFGCSWVSIWQWVDVPSSGRLALAARFRAGAIGEGGGHAAQSLVGRTIAVPEQSALREVVSRLHPSLVAQVSTMDAGLIRLPDRMLPTLMAPIRTIHGELGVGVAQSIGDAPSETELRVLGRVLDHLAFCWQMVTNRAVQDDRIHTLKAAIDVAPVGMRVIEGDGWMFRNRQDREFFPEEGVQSAMVEAEGAALDHLESPGEMTIQDDAGRQFAVETHRLERPDASGDVSGPTVVLSRELSAATSDEEDADRVRRDLRGNVATSRALSDVLRATQGAVSAFDVVQRGAPVVVEAMGGVGALFDLRDRDGQFRPVPFGEQDANRDAVLQHAALSYPTTVLALAGRRPVVLVRHEAATFEREMMEHMGWGTLLVAPLIARDEQLGFAIIGYAGDEVPERAVVALAGALAGALADAIVSAQAIERLTEELRHLTAVLDQVPQAVLIGEGGEGTIGFANEAAERLWHWPTTERPRTISDLAVLDATGEPIERDLHPLLLAARTGRSLLGEPLTIRTHDGEVVEVLGTIAPVLAQDGTIGGSVIILQDRSQFRRLEEAKEAFVALVAHELRNPLTAVVGNVQLLGRRLRREPSIADAAVHARVESIARQVDLIAALVTRLLDRSRLEFGQLDIAPIATDAVAIVQRTSEDAKVVLGERPLVVSAPAQLPVQWDEVRMGQVMANLLSNAVRHGEGAVEVAIAAVAATSASPPGAMELVRIEVRDHGPGIDPIVRARLFKAPPRHADDPRLASSSDGHGLGIGLFLSERIVAAHGGTTSVEDAEGGGTRIVMEVPAIALPGSVTAMAGMLHYEDA